MINSVSTKTAVSGERVYLESVFPILVNGHVVIPPGSYVAGTVTEVKRPGRVKGRGELYVRFDSLTLPNGVTRDFRARMGSLDGRAPETLDKSEGKIKGEGDKAGDIKTVGEATGIGATVGGLAGAAAGHAGMGAGIGAAAGATAGLVGCAADARTRRDSRQRHHHGDGARPAVAVQHLRDRFPQRHATRAIERWTGPPAQPQIADQSLAVLSRSSSHWDLLVPSIHLIPQTSYLRI